MEDRCVFRYFPHFMVGYRLLFVGIHHCISRGNDENGVILRSRTVMAANQAAPSLVNLRFSFFGFFFSFLCFFLSLPISSSNAASMCLFSRLFGMLSIFSSSAFFFASYLKVSCIQISNLSDHCHSLRKIILELVYQRWLVRQGSIVLR